MKRWLDGLISTLIPRSCLICLRPMQRGLVCTMCTPTRIPYEQYCLQCGEHQGLLDAKQRCTFCVHLPQTINQMRTLWNYDEKASALIKVMKYGSSYLLAKWCASEIIHAISSFENLQWDCIAPIPLDRDSERRRGFNQCAIIGNYIAHSLGLPLRADICTRNSVRPPQATLSSKERIQNARNLYAIKDSVVDKKILLIDDVVTTGATVSATALEFKREGALSVDVLSLARSQSWHTFRYRISKTFMI